MAISPKNDHHVFVNVCCVSVSCGWFAPLLDVAVVRTNCWLQAKCLSDCWVAFFLLLYIVPVALKLFVWLLQQETLLHFNRCRWFQITVLLGSFWWLQGFGLLCNRFMSGALCVVHRLITRRQGVFWWLSSFNVLSSSVVWRSDCWLLLYDLFFRADLCPVVGRVVENETIV